ncbi:serine/threonine-protein kinase nekl-2-like [Agrilus planipennis]|uniref:non-specific serine/threonine protein kinase n=1 Tax=Agrilus planipennis TaxID=224129 RepID=A0A1W4WR22_AGRPL|nr:serine/threonine-protein kinase nekl-2-like [Agrilus planipennis]
MGSFNILDKLGSGTFGTVFLCERKHNKVKIVLKEIKVDIHSNQLLSAKNEVSILKSLNHPNIVQYYDSYISNGIFYIVMEYASKGTLHELLNNTRPNYLPQSTIMCIFCQILNALNHIHEKNIIHRDLKAENIFMTGLKGDVVKIGDFGISKTLFNDGKAHTVIGTTNYLAPEMCDGHPYDIKSDVWALGCLLYELCALEKMFDGSISNVVLAVASGHRKQININLYEDGLQIQTMIDAMLQRNPTDRPDTLTLMKYPVVFTTYYTIGTYLGCIQP